MFSYVDNLSFGGKIILTIWRIPARFLPKNLRRGKSWSDGDLSPEAVMRNYAHKILAQWQNYIGIVPSGYRLLAYIVAFAQILVFSPGGYSLVPPDILLIGVGIYTLFKVIWPFFRRQENALGYTLLWLDIAVCVFLVISTGGIYSPFLLYTLSPVLTAALFMSSRLTFSVAVISVAYVIGSHLGNPFFPTRFSTSEVSYFMVYMIAISLTGILPYVINANMRQRLQAEGIISERQRISREIHDGVAQTLTMLRWRVQLLQRRLVGTGVGSEEAIVEAILLEKLAEKAQYDAREALELLHDNSYYGCFLPHLRDQMEHLKRDTGISVSLDIGADSVNLDAVVEIELLRICQEALANIRNHSEASNAQVKLKTAGGYLQVTISDDGDGFDIPADYVKTINTRGYGLAVMQERAELIGGKFHVTSAPGQGTEVKVEVPRDPHGIRVLWQK